MSSLICVGTEVDNLSAETIIHSQWLDMTIVYYADFYSTPFHQSYILFLKVDFLEETLHLM